MVESRRATADRPKQICRGKVTDYELDFDGKNVTIKVKAEPQFAGCELKLKVTPDKHEDKGGGLILFPYDKLPVKITIEGQFVCKKEGGGTLIVPIDSLSITFQPPDTFIYPLR